MSSGNRKTTLWSLFVRLPKRGGSYEAECKFCSAIVWARLDAMASHLQECKQRTPSHNHIVTQLLKEYKHMHRSNKHRSLRGDALVVHRDPKYRSENKERDRRLAAFMLALDLPTSTLHHPALRDLLASVAPSFVAPRRFHMDNFVSPDLMQHLMLNLRCRLRKQMVGLCMVCDVWSNAVGRKLVNIALATVDTVVLFTSALSPEGILQPTRKRVCLPSATTTTNTATICTTPTSSHPLAVWIRGVCESAMLRLRDMLGSSCHVSVLMPVRGDTFVQSARDAMRVSPIFRKTAFFGCWAEKIDSLWDEVRQHSAVSEVLEVLGRARACVNASAQLHGSIRLLCEHVFMKDEQLSTSPLNRHAATLNATTFFQTHDAVTTLQTCPHALPVLTAMASKFNVHSGHFPAQLQDQEWINHALRVQDTLSPLLTLAQIMRTREPLLSSTYALVSRCMRQLTQLALSGELSSLRYVVLSGLTARWKCMVDVTAQVAYVLDPRYCGRFLPREDWEGVMTYMRHKSISECAVTAELLCFMQRVAKDARIRLATWQQSPGLWWLHPHVCAAFPNLARVAKSVFCVPAVSVSRPVGSRMGRLAERIRAFAPYEGIFVGDSSVWTVSHGELDCKKEVGGTAYGDGSGGGGGGNGESEVAKSSTKQRQDQGGSGSRDTNEPQNPSSNSTLSGRKRGRDGGSGSNTAEHTAITHVSQQTQAMRGASITHVSQQTQAMRGASLHFNPNADPHRFAPDAAKCDPLKPPVAACDVRLFMRWNARALTCGVPPEHIVACHRAQRVWRCEYQSQGVSHLAYDRWLEARMDWLVTQDWAWLTCDHATPSASSPAPQVTQPEAKDDGNMITRGVSLPPNTVTVVFARDTKVRANPTHDSGTNDALAAVLVRTPNNSGLELTETSQTVIVEAAKARVSQ